MGQLDGHGGHVGHGSRERAARTENNKTRQQNRLNDKFLHDTSRLRKMTLCQYPKHSRIPGRSKNRRTCRNSKL
jgi:hypothetical protein